MMILTPSLTVWSTAPPGAVFSIWIHHSVVKTLMTNADEYAAKAVGTNKIMLQFKTDPTVAGLHKFLASRCCLEWNIHDSELYTRVKKNWVHLLDSSDDESPVNTTPAATQSTDHPSKNKKHKRSTEILTATIDNPIIDIKVKSSRKNNKKRKKSGPKEWKSMNQSFHLVNHLKHYKLHQYLYLTFT